MKNHPGMTALKIHACRAAMAATISMGLIGCESALTPPGSSTRDDRYLQALMTRAILEGTHVDQVAATYNGGVRELSRVDSAGPATVPTAAAGPSELSLFGPAATKPVTGEILSIAQASKVGLPSAQLNQDEPVMNLSLQETIMRGAKHALAIKVESYNPAIKEAQIVEAMAALDPVIFGSSQWNSTDEPQLFPLSPSLSNGQTWANQIGIRQLLPSGAQVQAAVTGEYHLIDTTGVPAATANSVGDRRTTYSVNASLQLSQPLLRGFGSDVTEANIYLAQRDYRISLSEFKQRTINSVSDIEEAYHNLVLARTNVEVLERLVVASQQTFDTVWERRNLDATKASINEAKQALDSRAADLHVAAKAYRAQSDRLKSLINDPEIPVGSNILINPIDKPLGEPIAYDVTESVDTALRQRPEMQQARLQVERADIVVAVAKNGLLPKLDLTAGLQTNGLSNSPNDAFGQTLDTFNSVDYNAGIKFEIPLGNREAESIYRRRQDERRQAIENLLQVAQSIEADVKTQLREVMSSYDELALRDTVRQDAAAEFEGILEIEDIRPRTPEFLQLKLDSQARLATAEQQLIQTLVNYNLAIMRLEKAKGTLLEFDRISLDRPPIEPDEGANFLRLMGKTWFKRPPTVMPEPIMPVTSLPAATAPATTLPGR